MIDVKFYKGTDNDNINRKELGITNNLMLPDRGLEITIRHNGSAGVYRIAWELQDEIVKFLNEKYAVGEEK